ncbi:MAG: hypothetical protein Kow00124_22840 [Anaerolineae bacterium]
MREKPIPLIVMVILLAGALACNFPFAGPADATGEPATAWPTATPEQMQTAPIIPATPTQEAPPAAADPPFIEVTATPAPNPAGDPGAPPRGALIYESDLRTGWPVIDTDFGTGNMIPTGYQIIVEHEEPWALWVYTTLVRESEFYAEVTVTPNECPTGQGAYGLLFHYESEARFRFFVVACSGGFTLFERSAPGSTTTLVSGVLPAGSSPATGDHVLGVRSQGGVVTLYYDSVELGKISVADMPAGDIGPYIQTSEGRMAATFSRLAVYRP